MAEKETGFIKIQLQKDLVKNIKRGHCWVYGNALRTIPDVKAGTPAILLDNRGGNPLAVGFLDPKHPIAYRICSTQITDITRESWLLSRLASAAELRTQTIPPATDAFRLINGEGDGLPGLICDIYRDYAVIQFDSPACMDFYAVDVINRWLQETFQISTVIDRSRFLTKAKIRLGKAPASPVDFTEYGNLFSADLMTGQKTGFFLDQRENRRLIQSISAGKSILNVFGYTGGFSIYAGMGGANEVTTVDIAKPAVQAAQEHWEMNYLPSEAHHAVAMDAYQFLDDAITKQQRWDLVILDPPSFAHSEEGLPKAISAYQSLIQKGAAVTNPRGYLAVASCSSHLTREPFIQCCEEGVAKARRKAIFLRMNSQPADHPAPLIMTELQYLKFVLLRIAQD
jgi:23S rRNA (cytosine1962-C5)-methyltransferase